MGELSIPKLRLPIAPATSCAIRTSEDPVNLARNGFIDIKLPIEDNVGEFDNPDILPNIPGIPLDELSETAPLIALRMASEAT